MKIKMVGFALKVVKSVGPIDSFMAWWTLFSILLIGSVLFVAKYISEVPIG